MNIFRHAKLQHVAIPYVDSTISAGFPSPAEDSIDQALDLNEFLIQHKAATFFIRVSGNSMKGAGIQSGDMLIVDRSLEVIDGAIVIAVLDGEFTVKYFREFQGEKFLVPANQAYKKIHITSDMDFTIWGVVTFVIHKT